MRENILEFSLLVSSFANGPYSFVFCHLYCCNRFSVLVFIFLNSICLQFPFQFCSGVVLPSGELSHRHFSFVKSVSEASSLSSSSGAKHLSVFPALSCLQNTQELERTYTLNDLENIGLSSIFK